MINIELITLDINNLKLKFTSDLEIKKYIETTYKLNVNDQNWYMDGKKINHIKDNNKYIVITKNNFINIKVKKEDSIISLPQISRKTKIKEINKIFNFNNLYFNNKKLKSNHTLDKYNITDNSILHVNI
jgi:hypothetical protein